MEHINLIQIDERIEHARRLLTAYASTPDGRDKMFALATKAGRQTIFLLYHARDLLDMFDAFPDAFRIDDTGARWRGCMVNRLPIHTEFARITVSKSWQQFRVGANGTMSDEQEQAVVAALNGSAHELVFTRSATSTDRNITRFSFEWTGHNHRRGVSDAIGIDAHGNQIDIEVKGFNGRLFHSMSGYSAR